jgi:serine/threonine protein kinase
LIFAHLLKHLFLQLKNDQFKLGDFGLVSKISYHQDVEEGDSRYMSMELLSGEHDDLTKSDIFSLGITFYQVCLRGKSLPTNGPEWQALRSADVPIPPVISNEMQLIIRQMMDPAAATRPTASELLKRPQLLSDEQKALQAEKEKVLVANLALVAQQQKLNRMMTPLPPRKGLVRANTWNGV